MTKMLFFLNFLCLAVLDLSCCTRAFSSWGEQGLLSSCSACTSCCGVFSYYGAQILDSVPRGLSCPRACGMFLHQVLNPVPCIGRQIGFSPTGPQGKSQDCPSCLISEQNVLDNCCSLLSGLRPMSLYLALPSCVQLLLDHLLLGQFSHFILGKIVLPGPLAILLSILYCSLIPACLDVESLHSFFKIIFFFKKRSPGEGNGNLNSSILDQKIPWTKEPGGLQSIRSRTV